MDNKIMKEPLQAFRESSSLKLDKNVAEEGWLDKARRRARPGESVMLEVPAYFGGVFGPHHKCWVVVTNQRLIFSNHNDKQQSFDLSRDDLERSTLSSVYGRHLKIKTENEPEHIIRLDKGNLERIVSALEKDPITNTTLRDFSKDLLWAIPLVWLVGGALLADAYRDYMWEIMGIALVIPMLSIGFFGGRGGTLLVIIVMAITAVWNAIEGAYPLWAGGIALLVGVGLSFLGEAIRGSFRKES